MKHVVIVGGGGFAGLNAARELCGRKDVRVTVLDRRNHHLFQPLLYQVAMAGLSPADIAAPIRGLLTDCENIEVFQEEVLAVDVAGREVETDVRSHRYDYLLVATGSGHAYFGNPEWEEHAPGLKTLAQATEIRRRVLAAFERAELASDPEERRRQLTFVIVGGGPTGVELAGAIGEMSRFTLARDFRHIDPKLTRVILVEAMDKILPMFSPKLRSRAVRDLETLGVQVWTNSPVSGVDARGVRIGEERLESATVLWAAGVKASPLGKIVANAAGIETDRRGRVPVAEDLSLAGHPEVFVAGDLAVFAHTDDGNELPGLASVAMQQGRFIGRLIAAEAVGKAGARGRFRYRDKGQMATIGRSRAIAEVLRGRVQIGGFLAWLIWLVVHIYYLAGFQNRVLVVIQWAWSYASFKRGARLIVDRDWRSRRSPIDGEQDTTA